MTVRVIKECQRVNEYGGVSERESKCRKVCVRGGEFCGVSKCEKFNEERESEFLSVGVNE